MRIEVLGPLRAVRDDGGEVALGGRQQRLTLAILVIADGVAVPTDVLVHRVWDGEPPATARKALQGYIHQLRGLLGPVIETRDGGYALPRTELDATDFDRLHRAARETLTVDPGHAGSLLAEALALWHGPAFADLRDNRAVEDAARALDEQRVVAIGDHVDARLALGEHRQLAPELETLVAEHPFRERFVAQLATAQYRCGRQVDALRSLDRHRRSLAEDLGLEPSAELRGLEERILRQDPGLDVTASATDTPTSIRGFELRELLHRDGDVERYRAYQRSVGRDVLLTTYGARLADDPDFVAGYEVTARAIAALEHPHVVPLLDTWREPGRAYRVTAWLGGGTLAERLAAGPVSLPVALQTVRDIGEALDAAHRAGVRHGSLTATAVPLDRDGRAYLGDFDLAPPPGGHDPSADRRAFAALAAAVLADAPPAVAAVLGEAVTDEPLGVLQLVRALEGATGLAPVPVASDTAAGPRVERRNPYKGLRAFGEVDRDDFHGREDLTAALVDAVDRHRLVAVVGASGSGKSSAVRAGLLPILRARTSGPRLLVTSMLPGAHPFEELETALLRIAVDRAPLRDLVHDARGLVRAVKRIRPDDDAEVLLLVDQFEELFTMADEGVRERFVDALVAATEEPRSPLRVVLTLRADFFDRPLAHARLGPLVRRGLVPVTMPAPDELARAIAAPARAEGVEFADGLVTQVVEDVGRQPGALPLLQHALTELFEARAGDTITLADYRSAGGVLGAVGRRADALYEELTPVAREALRQVLLRLVAVDDDTRDLRRRVSLAELRGLGIDDRGLDAALQAFARHRLLVFDRDEATRGATVEIAHEALLREWPRLAEWVAEHRDDLRMRRRLVASVDEWSSADEDPAYLARGRRLAELEGWAGDTSLALGHAEHSFLQQSIEAEEQAARDAAARRRRTTTGLVAASVVLALVAGFALVQRADARQVAFEAETARLAATARALAEEQPRVAILLARTAYDREESPSTLGALQVALSQASPLLGTLGHGTAYIDAAWTAQDLVVGIREDGVDLHDPATGAWLDQVELDVGRGRIEFGRGEAYRSASARDVPLVAVAVGTDVVLFEVTDGELIEVDRLSADGEVAVVEVAADGSWVAAGTIGGGFLLWDGEGALVLSEDLSTGRDNFTEAEYQLGPLPLGRGILEGRPVVAVPEAVGDEVWVTVVATIFRFAADGTRLGSTAAAVEILPDVLPDAPFPTMDNLVFPTESGELVVVGTGMTVVSSFDEIGAALMAPFEGTTGVNADPFPAVYAGGLVWSAVSDGRFIGFDPATGTRVVEHDLGLSGTQSTTASATGDRLVLPHDDGLALLSPLEASPISAGIPRDDVQRIVSVTRDGDVVVLGPQGVPGPISVLDVDVDGGQATATPVDVGAEWGIFALAPRDVPGLVSVNLPDRELLLRVDGSSVERLGEVRPSEVGLDAHVDAALTTFVSGAQRAVRVDLATGVETPLPPPGADQASPAPVAVVNFSPDGTRLLHTLADGSAQLLDTTTWQPVRVDELADLDVVVGDWNEDGTLLATASLDGTVTIRDAATLAPRRTLVGTVGTGNLRAGGGMLFFDDDRRLLTNFDGPARLWDLTTGEQIGASFPRASETSTGINGGTHPQLVTAGERTAQLWNLDLASWPTIACRAAGSNLTEDEWAQWGPRDTPYGPVCEEFPLP